MPSQSRWPSEKTGWTPPPQLIAFIHMLSFHTWRFVASRSQSRIHSFQVVRFFSASQRSLFCSTTMAETQSGTQTPISGASTPVPRGKAVNNKPPKKEVKILMLHGYTQSGPLFRAKTRAVEKLLVKALAPRNFIPSLIYPTAPNRLYPRDIPGYQPSSDNEGREDEEIDSWAWFRKDEATGSYRLVQQGMLQLASAIEETGGGIEGVIGFSQGGCVASILAAALEGFRQPAEEHKEWVESIRAANGGQPLKFWVSYSGFWAVDQDLSGWLYQPKVKTPSLHYFGGLDTVVDESRSQGLVERSEGAVKVVHPGGHYVPVSKEWVVPLAGFVLQSLTEAPREDEKL
ncbi:Family of serine hydrolases 3 [Podospora pseudoanserina]|uniref:Family of serine hydrolases 3 n=1 Tax=Podospora pseudoanserina TaxID=2609844 RepID=A0ABR0HVC7_9PEZI|nr:Family of serine hydrolases 3 [Podospora pseudoanserina]